MRKLLNTLYVQTEGAYVRRDGLNVVVEVDHTEKLRVPLHLLGGVAVFGQVSLSPALMGSLAEAGIVTAFFGMNGRFLARVEGPISGNVLLRREQYRVMDDGPACTRIARSMVMAKALNQRGLLQRAVRDHGVAFAEGGTTAIAAAIERMGEIARRALHETDLDRLRGHEGEPPPGILAHSATRCARTIRRLPSAAVPAGRRWTRSTRCFRSSTRCWCTTAAVPWRGWA